MFRYNNFWKIIFILALVSSCACPDKEFRKYNAHVYLNNKTESEITVDYRVLYHDGSEMVSYVYDSIVLEPGVNTIAKTETGYYGNWDGKKYHCDYVPPSLGDEKSPTKAWFHKSLLENFSLCEGTVNSSGQYSINDKQAGCEPESRPIDIANGWE